MSYDFYIKTGQRLGALILVSGFIAGFYFLFVSMDSIDKQVQTMGLISFFGSVFAGLVLSTCVMILVSIADNTNQTRKLIEKQMQEK
jgi:uncharacterized membrane protein